MNNYENRRRGPGREKLNILITSIVIIAIGLIFLSRNLGYIDRATFKILISWQMMLIVIGVASMIKRGFTSGLIVAGIGVFFLFPKIFGGTHHWISTYWPMALVAVGLVILLRLVALPNSGRNRRTEHIGRRGYHVGHGSANDQAYDEARHTGQGGATSSSANSQDGYVTSDNTFGSVRHIVLDDVFLGADLRSTFGGTILDLRHTKIGEGDTIINVNASFSGIEIYVPYNWVVVLDVDQVLSGTEDKRHESAASPIDKSKRLVVQGRALFSGVEIRN